MEEKICTKCKKKLPNTEEYFHLDKTKVKLGHNVVLAAACKKCKNSRKRITEAKRRAEIIKKYGSTYKYQCLKNPNHLEESRERNKKYYEKTLERNRKYRRENRPFELLAKEKRKIYNKKQTEEITDYYVARLIHSNNKTLSLNELLDNKELLDLHRLNLKIKRLCRQ